MRIENIAKTDAVKVKQLLKELRPGWDICVIEEDINLYRLGFVLDIPCSLMIHVAQSDIDTLMDELMEMEADAYYDEAVLYAPSTSLSKEALKRKHAARSRLEKYEKYQFLENILR